MTHLELLDHWMDLAEAHERYDHMAQLGCMRRTLLSLTYALERVAGDADRDECRQLAKAMLYELDADIGGGR